MASSRWLFWRIAILLWAAIAQAQPQPGVNDRFFFVQMADPQFGMFTKDRDFAQETANYEFAIATANRLKPRFVIVCGDLVNKPGDQAQIEEYRRISAKLDPSIRLYHVAGNHDVGNEPTPQTLADYRKRFGPDYYSFQEGSIYGIVLNSSLIHSPGNAMGELEKQESWLRAELTKAKSSGFQHIVIFQHHPFFLERGDEPDQYFNIPLVLRTPLLNLFRQAGVKHLFAGHYHRNAHGWDGDIEMVTTGPVGMPLGGARSGLRIVEVSEQGIRHQYYEFGALPNQVPAAVGR
ncbi:MAG: metallophosphoesterase [Bryobacteraceae bacterium]|nr:metallophosphoesterase [Bryobacteraceae bacterium]